MNGKHRLILASAVLVSVAIVGVLLVVCVLSFKPASGPSANGEARAPAEVAAAYKQIEKAMREGDGKLYLSLMDRATRSQMDAQYQAILERGIPPQPWVHLEPVAVRARGDQAFVIGSFENPQTPDGVKCYLVRYV